MTHESQRQTQKRDVPRGVVGGGRATNNANTAPAAGERLRVMIEQHGRTTAGTLVDLVDGAEGMVAQIMDARTHGLRQVPVGEVLVSDREIAIFTGHGIRGVHSEAERLGASRLRGGYYRLSEVMSMCQRQAVLINAE